MVAFEGAAWLVSPVIAGMRWTQAYAEEVQYGFDS